VLVVISLSAYEESAAWLSREPARPAARSRFLDRVLDKGIVIDAWFRIAVMGIDVITGQAHVVVASIQNLPGLIGGAGLAGSASTNCMDEGGDEHERSSVAVKQALRNGNTGAPCREEAAEKAGLLADVELYSIRSARILSEEESLALFCSRASVA